MHLSIRGRVTPRLQMVAIGWENIILRVLIRQVIPLLLQPEGYSRSEREHLARTLTLALERRYAPTAPRRSCCQTCRRMRP